MRWMLALGILLLCANANVVAAPIPTGNSKQIARIVGMPIQLFIYRPACRKPNLLLVFHGLSRRVHSSLKSAQPIADRLCLIEVVPFFDKKRFPSWRYQLGGIVNPNMVVQPRSQWTVHAVAKLVAWARAKEGRALDYWLIGHSAGGQFLSRVAAFDKTNAKRIVISNPSTYVFPSLYVAAPYGLGDVYSYMEGTAQLRQYLTAPVTIYLGQDDIGDKDRSDSPPALAEGVTRYDRGRNVYEAGERIATDHGWRFNWRLIEVPRVGHSARKMFSAREALNALAP
jgi:pimeloyl-ACP methyl ester carboxylesterase